MEAILGLILVVGMYMVFAMVLNAGARTVKAAGRAAMGKGTLPENMALAFKGMPAFETRIQAGRIGDDDEGPFALEVQARGLFPVLQRTRVGVITSIFDASTGQLQPVTSLLDPFQESESVAYQHVVTIGDVEPDQGFIQWVRVGVALPEIIQPPRTGRRTLKVVVRVVDTANPPPIVNGFSVAEGHPGLLWVGAHDYEFDFDVKGYEDESEDRDEARGLGVKIGVAVAMSDGRLDDTEGATLRDWILRSIAPYHDERQHDLKRLFNQAMRDAFDEAQRGQLSLTTLTRRMNEISDRSTKYEAIELCFDVMAADGRAHAEELKLIRSVADALELDYEEIQRLRDHRIVGLDRSVSDEGTDTDELLGISEHWSREQTLAHIRSEYQKWSNRLNVLPEGDERENAQRMLDLLAAARRRYDDASAS